MQEGQQRTSDETNQGEPSRRQLVTERAVFRPHQQTNEVIKSVEEPTRAALRSSNEPHEVSSSLQSGEYRVPILYLGRDELIAALPDDETRIRQLTDLEIEALALEIEDSLTEIYGMVLRIVWTAFLSSKSSVR